jgi:tetratricopeptide (TPR) repeat protein
MPSKKNKEMDATITRAMMDDVGRFEYFFITNWKLIVAVMVGLVIAVGVYFSAHAIRESSRRKADKVLAAAKDESALTAALATYGSAPSAGHARMRLARIYIAEKRFDDAAAQLRQIREKGELSGEFIERVRLEEAYLYETAGKTAEAAALFDEIGRNFAASAATRAEADYSAGRLYAGLGQKEQALECLKRGVALLAELDPTNVQWCYLAQFTLVQLEEGVYGKTAAAPAAPADAKPKK